MATEAERTAARAVLAARSRRREELLDLARRFDRGLDEGLDVRAVVVVGSVARGDFNRWSDVDILVVADTLPGRTLDRLEALLENAPPGVQPIAWTTAELAEELRRRNPIAEEALGSGVAIRGADELRGLGPRTG